MLKKTIIVLFLFASLYVGFGVWIGGRSINVLSPISKSPSSSPYYDYSGIINVHSTKSAGSGSYDEIIEAAKASDVKFVITTDTGDYNPDASKEAYFGETMLLVGGEYPYLDSRVLNFGFSNTEHLSGPGRTQMIFSDLLSKSQEENSAGMFVLAHPVKPRYEWQGEIPMGFHGVEVFNLKSIWQTVWKNQKSSFFASLLIYPLHYQWSLLRMFLTYPQPELNLWDKANIKHPLYGYVGSDADSRIRNLGKYGLKFPPYETFFSILKNHVLLTSELTGKFEDDKAKILNALSNGNSYIALDLIGTPRGFYTVVEDQVGKTHLMGSKVDRAKKYVVDIGEKPTAPFEVIIYHNGEPIITSTSIRTEHQILSPGAYRSIVKTRIQLPFPDGREWVTWIVSNPHFVSL